jgi:membrane protein
MVSLIDSLNNAYDVEDARPWWKQRLVAIGLTVGIAVFIIASFALVLAGPELADWLAGRLGLGSAFAWTWKILQWPIVFSLVALALVRRLLLRPRCRAGLRVPHAGVGAGDSALAAGFAGVPLLCRQFRVV